MQLLCQVYFRPEAGEPFERVKKARHAVWVAASMLIRTAGEPGMDSDSNRKLVDKWRSQIWEGSGADGPQGTEDGAVPNTGWRRSHHPHSSEGVGR